MHRSSKGFRNDFSQNGFQNGHSSSHLEEENDEITNALGHKISELKKVTIAIGNEVRNQNRFLGEMDSDMESASSFLGSAMKKLGKIQKAGYNSYVIKLLCVAFIFFFILWLVLKFR